MVNVRTVKETACRFCGARVQIDFSRPEVIHVWPLCERVKRLFTLEPGEEPSPEVVMAIARFIDKNPD